MMSDNTLILPDNTSESENLLLNLIQKGDVIIIAIFGNDDNATKAAAKADIRASFSPAGIKRMVAWLQDINLVEYLKTILKNDTGGMTADIDVTKHTGVSISMNGGLRYMIPLSPEPDEIRMEKAFLMASKK